MQGETVKFPVFYVFLLCFIQNMLNIPMTTC